MSPSGSISEAGWMNKEGKRQRTGEFCRQTCSNWHISAKHFTFNGLSFFLTEADFLETFLTITSQTIMKPQETQKCSLLLYKRGLWSLLESEWPFLLELVMLQILWVLFVPSCGFSASCYFSQEFVLEQQPACICFGELWTILQLWPHSCAEKLMFWTVLPRQKAALPMAGAHRMKERKAEREPAEGEVLKQ